MDAVILNDTSTRSHHGCARVMRLLVAGLEGAGLRIAARSPARAEWSRDRAFLAALAGARVVVINGEGTLHDGAPLGARLLSVLDHPAAAGKPVALVNALWQRNPPEWSAWLRRLALVAARDGGSAAEMTLAGARGVRWLPDLSLSAPAGLGPLPRRGLVVGDSVRLEARRELARAAQRLRAAYVPTKTLGGALWRWGPARGALWRLYNGVGGPVPPFEMPRDEAAYLRRIAQAEGHVTGRFHAVCLSLLTGTPVLALASKTSKVERLLADLGLGGRLLGPRELSALTPDEAAQPFDAAEREAIAAYLATARKEARRLFADLRGLAG